MATLNSILNGFAEENSHVTVSTVVPTALTIGLRYSRLYVPELAALTSSSVNSSLLSEYIEELEQKLSSENVINKDDLELRKSDFNELIKSLQNR